MWRSRHEPFKISPKSKHTLSYICVRCEHCWKEKWCMMCFVNYHIEGRRTNEEFACRPCRAHKTAAELSKHFLPATACLFIIYWSAQFTRWWMRKRICAAAAINSRSIGPADEKYALARRYLMYFFSNAGRTKTKCPLLCLQSECP